MKTTSPFYDELKVLKLQNNHYLLQESLKTLKQIAIEEIRRLKKHVTTETEKKRDAVRENKNFFVSCCTSMSHDIKYGRYPIKLSNCYYFEKPLAYLQRVVLLQRQRDRYIRKCAVIKRSKDPLSCLVVARHVHNRNKSIQRKYSTLLKYISSVYLFRSVIPKSKCWQ
jgi:hypothetical protein